MCAKLLNVTTKQALHAITRV